MRADGAAVVHLSPHAARRARGRRRQRGGHRGDGRPRWSGLGHRRIAFLAGPRVAVRRARAPRRATAAGLADAGHRVRRAARRAAPAFDREGGALGVDTLLAGDAPFTAICCANDLLALGALQRLAELGIDVPGDVSVAGFDDISTAAMTAPSLSTVRLPLREMGRRGFEHADRLLAGDRPDRRGAADRGRPARLDRRAAGRRAAGRGTGGPPRRRAA